MGNHSLRDLSKFVPEQKVSEADPLSYVHQINLILAALGTPDEATLVRVGSEKVSRIHPHDID